MDIDFSLVLVLLVMLCGGLWLLDSLLLRRSRMVAIDEYNRNQAKGRKKDEIDRSLVELSKEPLVIEYAKSFFPVLFLVLVLRSFLIEPFQIPTGSMIPTLNVGDFILVNKYAYGVRLPVIGTKIVDVDHPKRGEVMAVSYTHLTLPTICSV